MNFTFRLNVKSFPRGDSTYRLFKNLHLRRDSCITGNYFKYKWTKVSNQKLEVVKTGKKSHNPVILDSKTQKRKKISDEV